MFTPRPPSHMGGERYGARPRLLIFSNPTLCGTCSPGNPCWPFGCLFLFPWHSTNCNGRVGVHKWTGRHASIWCSHLDTRTMATFGSPTVYAGGKHGPWTCPWNQTPCAPHGASLPGILEFHDDGKSCSGHLYPSSCVVTITERPMVFLGFSQRLRPMGVCA